MSAHGPIDGRTLFTDWTLQNGGMMKGGYGFLSPSAKAEIEYYAKRLNDAAARIKELEAQNQWQDVANAIPNENYLVSRGVGCRATAAALEDGVWWHTSDEPLSYTPKFIRPMPAPPVAANENALGKVAS